MHTPKIILVPVDFGNTSLKALEYAITLAQALRSEIVLVHAYEVPVVSFLDVTLISSAESVVHWMTDAQTGLQNVHDRYKDRGVSLRMVLKQETPWRGILATADEVQADLIVMGTEGRKGLPRTILGSVAEKVLRQANCPVLTVSAHSTPST